MTESAESKYFVDGFLIRHFNIFPLGFDKENLFEKQKVFLMYLMAQIPELKSWKINIEYQQKLAEINKIDNIELEQTEIDLAKIKGTKLSQIKREKIFAEKKKRIQELNKKYGVEESEQEIEKVVETKQDITENNPKELWEILQGKGLIKNGL